MPIHTVELPNGQHVDIDAPDAKTALAGAQQYWAQHPDPTGVKRWTAAQQFAKDRDNNSGMAQTLYAQGMGASWGLLGDIDAGRAKLQTMVENLGRDVAHKPYRFTSDQAYRAVKQRDMEDADAFAKAHPVTNFVANMQGGLIAPGGTKLGNWAADAPTFLGKVARGAAVGGGTGAVYGAASAPDGQRLEGAMNGGITGTVLGGGIPIATRVLGSAFSAMVPRTRQQQAMDLAAKDLALAGDSAQANLARNPDLTFAEAVGDRGMKRAKVVGNMTNLDASQTIAPTLAERIAGTPNRINRAAEGITGIAPEEAQAQIDLMTQRGQKMAAPLYDEAYAFEPDSPALRRIVERPSVREAMAPAAKNILNQDRLPYFNKSSLTLPDAFPTGEPTGKAADYYPDVLELMNGGVRKAEKAVGPSLSDHLAALGGLADETGDLRAFDAQYQLHNPGVGPLKKLVRVNGMPLDKAAEKAYEAGFFNHLPNQTELLDAIQRESAGKSMVSQLAPKVDPGRARYLEGLDQRISEAGLPGGLTPKQIAQALADQDAQWQHLQDWADGKFDGVTPDILQERVPTMEHLDHTKRVLDARINYLEERGDPYGQKPGLVSAKQALTEELRRQNPKYGEALETASDYLKNKAAFDAAPRRFMQGTNQDYDSYVASLSGPEREANLQGLLSDWNRRLNAKEGAPNSLDFLTSPNARAKLSVAAGHIGRDAGDNLYREILNAAEIRANARYMMPRNGSATQPLLRAEQDLMEEVGVKDIPTSQSEIKNFLTNILARKIKNVWYNVRLGRAAPVLEDYAKLLMQRGDITIAQIEKMPPSRLKSFFQDMANLNLKGTAGVVAGASSGFRPPLKTDDKRPSGPPPPTLSDMGFNPPMRQ